MAELLLSDLCERLKKEGVGARLEGEDRAVRAVNSLEEAAEGEITFLANEKYLSALRDTRASAVIVGEGVKAPERLSTIRCSDPYAGIAVAIVHIHGHRRHPQWGISEKATIHPTAKLGQGANIGEYVSIAADVTIGDDCTIYPGCYVAEGARLGNECTLFPNVVVYDRCELGNRVTVHAGSVIGEDGLGYAPVGDQWLKIPQVGKVVVGDDVEIGANCTIDRATLGRTEIGAGTKFGNVVVIGHGAKVGPDCLFVGLVGVAGSATVERHVTLAGQVGIAGHLTVGKDARVGAQAGVTGDVKAGSELWGTPAVPVADAKRAAIALQKLPEAMKRLKVLEQEVEELKAALGRT
ncbi:MAG: UDP-3-O-(3-hydroxymyristoyl)glucosamine N-acyltransferase [Phycisphaerales bacterium]|nr:MAG: UDP-3-O-(3-hydroxymyristoyl)glucosamine N-acyltransferase [Phycisphaerales bacterium]